LRETAARSLAGLADFSFDAVHETACWARRAASDRCRPPSPIRQQVDGS